MNHKRKKHISWDSYFFMLAIIASYRSKDPSTRNGACIIEPDTNSVLSLGYNGLPRGCDDNDFPWHNDESKKNDHKYCFVEHAE